MKNKESPDEGNLPVSPSRKTSSRSPGHSDVNEQLRQELLECRQREEALLQEHNLLRTIIEYSSDHIYVKDRQSRFLIANHVVSQILGVVSPEELLGKTDFDFHPKELAKRYYADEQRLLHDDLPLINREEPIIDHQSGETRWLLTTKIPFHDTQQKVAGLVGFNRDITTRKQAQEELKRVNRELRKRTVELNQANQEIQTLNALLQEDNLRMHAELDVARRLQQVVLPPAQELQQIPDVEVLGFMQPAAEVGGDYYDILQQYDSIFLGIGDVTGHGLESGILMLMLQTALRTMIEQGETDISTIIRTLNRALFKNIQRMKTDRTMTFSLVRYQNGCLTISGQHEEVLVLRQDGRIERIETTGLGFPLGLVEDISKWVSTTTIDLEPGDGIALYTDGITDAENREGEFYGKERLHKVLSSQWGNTSLEEMKEFLLDDIQQYTGEAHIHDDYTFVILQRRPSSDKHRDAQFPSKDLQRE